MKFGVREICDVVFKAKAKQTLGNRTFYKDEPVIYFDSLKTSTLEGAATTVYAQGGRGNTRLVAWEGERTVTFTMEDALISPLGFMILTGAGLIEGKGKAGDTGAKAIQVHTTDTIAMGDGTRADEAQFIAAADGADAKVEIPVSSTDPVSGTETLVYVMPLKNGEIFTEPFYGIGADGKVTVSAGEVAINGRSKKYVASDLEAAFGPNSGIDAVLIDYYTDKYEGAQQIEITADQFGGNYYIEASTLFRNTDGVDMPAEFIIPNAKVQSNFNFSLASSGDPSTFTFTMDAFPDYTRFDKTKKVLMAIQIIGENEAGTESYRTNTDDDKATQA